MIDIDNNWSNSNMDYDETDYDSDGEIDDYNYNTSTNNLSILTGDKSTDRLIKTMSVFWIELIKN